MRASRLQIPVALLLAGVWGLGVYVAHGQGRLGFLDRVESTMTDLRTLVRGTRVPPDWVTIVAIDDALVKKGGSYPLPRADLARIVDAIAGLAPKVLAIDLLLVDRGPEEGDDALAESLAARPAVIGAAAVFPEASQSVGAENEGPLARLPRAERFLLPLGKFAAHADIGIVNVATDRGGVPRAIPMLFRTSDRVEMSFPPHWPSTRNPPSSRTASCWAIEWCQPTSIMACGSRFTARAGPFRRSAPRSRCRASLPPTPFEITSSSSARP
jgi:adenylate cyclase